MSPNNNSTSRLPQLSSQTYYDILSVDRNACPKEIEKAYKRQALILHPDRNRSDSQSESTEKFQKLIEAYDVLKDPSKRKKYDLKISVAAGIESFRASTREAPTRKPPSRDPSARDERVPPMRANSTSSTSYGRFNHPDLHAKRRSTSDMFGDIFGDASAPRYPSGHTRPASAVPPPTVPRPPKPTVVTSPYISPYLKAPSAAKRPQAQVPTFYPRPRQAPSPAKPPLHTSPIDIDPPLRERRQSTSRPPPASPPRPAPDPYQTFERAWGKSLDELIAGLKLGSCSSDRAPDVGLRQGPRPSTRAAEEGARPGPRSTTRAAEEGARTGPRSTTRAADEGARPGPRSTTRAAEDGAWSGPRSTTRAAEEGPWPGPRSTTRAAEDGAWSGPRSTTRAAEEAPRPRPMHRSATMREDGRSERRARSSSTTGLQREEPVRHSTEWYGGPAYVAQHHQPEMVEERMRRRQTVYQSPLSASVGSPTSSHGLGAGGSMCSTPTTSVEDSQPSPRPGPRSRSATLDGGGGGGGGTPGGVKREFREVVYRYEVVGDGQTRVSREVRSRTVDLDGTIRDRYRRQRAAVVG